MKISIITVSYNSASTIRETIESVLSQIHIDLEYLLIDGNSTDGTLQIIKEYADKNQVIRWISQPDNGMYDAMNKGIAMASGNIIGILNSDDFYVSSDILSTVHNTITEQNRDSCYGNLLYIKNNKPYRYWKSGKQKDFRFGWMPPHPAFFVKKSVYEKFGNFRLDCGTAADYELMLRFFEKNSISTAYIPKVLVLMTAGGASNLGVKTRIDTVFLDRLAWQVNNLRPAKYTLFFKKLSKIVQFINAKIYMKRLTIVLPVQQYLIHSILAENTNNLHTMMNVPYEQHLIHSNYHFRVVHYYLRDSAHYR